MRFRVFLFLVLMSYATGAWACESCSLAHLGRDRSTVESQDGQWFVKYLYENQNWHEKEAGEAHAIHHQGHDVHDKTSEEFYHVEIGHRLNERLSLSVDLPYVTRHSIEVDNHAILGTNQKSMGLGDLQLIGDYRILNEPAQSVSFLGGVKFPTGATKESNSAGDRFETELQPGSGSYDYLVGVAWRRDSGRAGMTGNAAYVLRTEGAQDFRFGDVVSTSWAVDYLLNPDDRRWQTRVGLDAGLQYETREHDAGETVPDSGGVILLLGPTASIRKCDASLNGSFLLPAVQDLGGVHQHLDFVWTVGTEIRW
jgi:hypothetical protein